MKHKRTRRSGRKHWVAVGALAASAVVAGRPTASFAASAPGTANAARSTLQVAGANAAGVAPERLAISRRYGGRLVSPLLIKRYVRVPQARRIAIRAAAAAYALAGKRPR